MRFRRGFVDFFKVAPHAEDSLDTLAARHGFGNRNHEVGEFDKLHENLRHQVVQSDDVALRKGAVIHANRADFQKKNDGEIDENERNRVHQRADSARLFSAFR